MNKKHQIQKILDELIKVYSPKMEYDEYFNYRIYLNILFGILHNTIKGKTLEQKKSLLEKAFERFYRYKKHTWAFFDKALKIEWKKRQKIKFKPYYVLFLLYINNRIPSFLKNRNYFIICGNRFYLKSLTYIRKNYNFKAIESKLYDIKTYFYPNHFNLSQFIFVESKIFAPDPYAALHEIFVYYELFRAILNFSNNFCVLTEQWETRSSVNSFLPSPLYFIFDARKRKLLHYAYEVGWYKYDRLNIRHFRNKLFKLLIELFENKPHPHTVTHLIMNALIKYGRSLDSLDWESNFLKLWQTLELITLASQDEPIKTTKIRLKKLFPSTLKWEGAIDFISTLRNKLVHEGVFPQEEMFPLTLLKYIVENAIYQLLILKKKNILTFQDLINFYKYVNLSKEELSQKKKIIDFIVAFKNSTSVSII